MNYRVTAGKKTIARFDSVVEAQMFVRAITEAERYEPEQVRIVHRTGSLVTT